MRVTGTPPNHHVEEISSFPELQITGPEKTPEGKRRTYNDEYNLARARYVCGALAVGNRLYVSVYDYNDLASGKPRQLMDRISPHAGIVGIMYSDDHGKTWRNVPSKDDPNEGHPYFLGPRFAGLQFVGFGPGYTAVPAGLDGYSTQSPTIPTGRAEIIFFLLARHATRFSNGIPGNSTPAKEKG